ncbi:MAG: hypothetical protein GF364_12905 [Candidatus Lokiarchaeota archaeon]|nr:hypothetical protein [Candidatus Lokiarchaeota archaeon]
MSDSGLNLLELHVDEKYFKKLFDLKKEYKLQYFNARFNTSLSSSFRLEKSIMKSAHNFNNYGFSIQAFVDGGFGFSTCNLISIEELENSFREAAKLAHYSSRNAEKKFDIKELDPVKAKYIQPQKKKLLNISADEKAKYILEQDKQARNYDDRIVNTISSYSDTIKHELIVTSDERIIDLTSSYARIMVHAYSKEGNVNQSSRANIGITGGYEIVDMGGKVGIKAAKRAIEILNAKPVNAGRYDVIVDPYLAGTFAHEAFGHACEADAILANESQLAGKINQKVGPEFISIYEDPDIENGYGSIKYDSEGIKAKKIALIKNGILAGYMHSRETASKMDVEPTGNGRAQSFTSFPVVRMRNTYIEKGDWNLEEMLEELKNGILCINWNYGYTEPNIGQFMFKMERAWQIENGEKKQLLRDAALSGTMLNVLNKIRAISDNVMMDDGTCGKSGQHVPVGSGGPYLLINDISIGGM